MKRGQKTDCAKCLSLRKGFPKSPRLCARGWKIGTVVAKKDESSTSSLTHPLVNLDRLSFKAGGFVIAGYMTGKVVVKPEGANEQDLGVGAWRLEPCPDFNPEKEEPEKKTSS